MKKIVLTFLVISISNMASSLEPNRTNITSSKLPLDESTTKDKEVHSNDYYEKIYNSRIDSLNEVYINLYNKTKGSNPKSVDIDAKDAAKIELLAIVHDFIIDYPNCNQSLVSLNTLKATWGKGITSQLFSLMNDEAQESDIGKNIALYIATKSNLEIGDLYADFEQTNTKGEKLKISDIKGKYTLIEFWASWCGPCRANTPELIKEYEKYKKQGFQIIGVSLDNNKEKWLSAIEKDKMPWENISDLNGLNNKAALLYDVYSIPDNILIDENGVIIGRQLPVDLLHIKLNEFFNE